jgi:NAD(P)-dependent dehydrogenase (short-subunit alcohol dehydrogenase family)
MAKVVLVTGGSRGIGAEIVRRCARDGYDVALTYVTDKASASALAGEVEALGRRALCIKADVGVEADIVAAFTTVDREFKQLDAVVLNAGITGKFSRVEDLDAATLQSVMNVNVVGVFLCAREAVRRMSTKHGGSGGVIIAISSRAASLGSANDYVHYAASKGAVNTFVHGLGIEVAGEGIRIVGVSPGLIDTEIHARAGRPDRLTRAAPMIPMQRVGTATEVANAVAWAISDEASFVTATTIDVGGGR